MKRTESICTRDYVVRCRNCGDWIKEGSRVVTTVEPGVVIVAHETCPLPDSIAELNDRIDRHGYRISRRQARERRGLESSHA